MVKCNHDWKKIYMEYYEPGILDDDYNVAKILIGHCCVNCQQITLITELEIPYEGLFETRLYHRLGQLVLPHLKEVEDYFLLPLKETNNEIS